MEHRFRRHGEHEDYKAQDALSFGVERGRFLSILGSSGCGKTTLLRIIGGLVHPSVGEVPIDGQAIAGPHEKVSMVFQDFRLFPWRSVVANVESPWRSWVSPGWPAAARPRSSSTWWG